MIMASAVLSHCLGLKADHDRGNVSPAPIETKPTMGLNMFIEPQPIDPQRFFHDHPELRGIKRVEKVLNSSNASHFHFEESDSFTLYIASGDTISAQKIRPPHPGTINSVYWNLYIQNLMHIALHLKKDGTGIVEIGPGLETLSVTMNNEELVKKFKSQYIVHLGFKTLKRRFTAEYQPSDEDAKLTIQLNNNQEIIDFLTIIGEHFPL